MTEHSADYVAARLAYWQALYDESIEPPQPIPSHVVTVWDDGEMRLIDGSGCAP